MNWWTRRDSNPRPPHCERGALPAELLAPRVKRGYNLIYRSEEIKGKNVGAAGSGAYLRRTECVQFRTPVLRVFIHSFAPVLTNRPISAIVCRLTIPSSVERRRRTMRERQKELRRRRKRKEETLRAKHKAAKTEALAKKGK
jgi:hypothetical protein